MILESIIKEEEMGYKRIVKYRKPRRVEPNTIFDPQQGLLPIGGWVVGKVLVAKPAWESPVYREIVVLDNGNRLEIG